MKLNNIPVMITLVLVLLFSSNLTRSQENKPDMDPAMKKWMEAKGEALWV